MPDTENIYQKLVELQELYLEIKEAILFSETFDKDHDLYISPLNELRNTLDHVMRGIGSEKMEEEFVDAKEHLYRAGYDAYEVLAINIVNRIVRIVEKYDTKVISETFPAYYKDVKKHIIQTKTHIVKIRAKRNTKSIGITTFAPYSESIAKLIATLEEVEGRIPDLHKASKRVKWKKIIEYGVVFIIGVLSLIAYDKWKDLHPFSHPSQPKNIHAHK